MGTVAMAAAGAAMLGLLVVAAWRPPLACALLALAIPVTAGLPRGAVLPLLRVNEGLLLAVAAGFALDLAVRRRRLAFNGLDLAVLGFCLTGVLVPWAVILLTRAPAAPGDWVVVVGPLQYLVVYAVFSRTGLSDRWLRVTVNLAFAASIVVAAVAAAETVDAGGVRGLVDAVYPGLPRVAGDVYRPNSLLGHYSAVGAFGLLNLLLALALAAMRHPQFSRVWLAAVVGANLVGLLSSQTYAPIAVVPIGAGIVLLMAGRMPWRLLAAGVPVLGAAGLALRPSISGRLAAQFAGGGGSWIPETLRTRIDYWQGFFVPALERHGAWLGTGTLLPAEVPRPLVDFVDNGYLAQLFRAGVPGLLALLVLLAAVAAAGWSVRRHADPWLRVLGAVCVSTVAGVLLLNVTAEYLTFTAVSQEFWIVVGLLSGRLLAAQSGPGVVVLRPASAPRTPPGAPAFAGRLARRLRGLAPERALAVSTLSVAAGFGLARGLGFLFQVVAGRLLPVAGYGRLMYALAVANVAAVLLTTAPLGLSRFLSRSEGDRAAQRAYLTNWLAVIGGLLGLSAVVTAVAAGPLGLGGWLLAGLLANLLGAAVLETYREVQRGRGRYLRHSAFYVLANVLQLAALLAAAALGLRSAALFLAVFGLSPVVALAVMAPPDRGLRPAPRSLRPARMAAIGGFMRPVLLQALLWNVWFNADLLLVEHLRGAARTGAYGAAKAIANGLAIVPAAAGFVLAPRVARLREDEVRAHVVRALAATALVMVPLALAVAALAGPLAAALYGGRYAAAAAPLAVLAAAMVPYGLKTVLDGAWLGLGRPEVETAASGAGMAVTLALGLWLVPAGGPVAAAAAFGAGALAQLATSAAATAWAFGRAVPRVSHRRDRDLLEPRTATAPRAAVLAARVRRLAVAWAPNAAAAAFGTAVPRVSHRRDRDLLEPVAARAPRAAVLAARVRRLAVAWAGLPRRLAWGGRTGYVPRRPWTAAIVPGPEPAAPVEPAPALAGPVGVVDPVGDALSVAAVARLLGLAAEVAGPGEATPLLHRALAGGWATVSAPLAALTGLAEPGRASLAAFVNLGGMLLVDGVDAGAGERLRELGETLGVTLPSARPAPPAGRLLLPAGRASIGAELAGTCLETACGGCALVGAPSRAALALAGAAGTSWPVVVEVPVGRGRLVLSALARPPRQPLAEALASGRAGAALVPLLLIRRRHGAACWHAPAPLANFSIDDPALRQGLQGLDYDALAARAREHGYHVTIATVPRELGLAEEAAVRHLRGPAPVLSACYHGCDHRGYEFSVTGGRRTRHAPRPLADQRRALRRAVAHGAAFARVHRHQLDRVMVFPYGIGPAAILPDLDRLGFVASCNFGDKYPLEAPVPGDADLGLRPADVAWAGFPLLWRRDLADRGYLLDLVLGRPLLLFAHRRDLGRDLAPFAERADVIRRASGGRVAWRGLDEVARHAYLQREDADSGWEVLITAHEACIHNPGPLPRACLVRRPHLPPGRSLEVDGVPLPPGARVTLAPGGRALVRVTPLAPAPALPGRKSCSLHETRELAAAAGER